MMRVSGFLKLGKIHSSELVRTLYLLNYIDDLDYRRRILIWLDRGEKRRSIAPILFDGQRGEIRKRYPDAQKDQLGALGFVTNAVVLWNTIYMETALDYLQQNSISVKEEDQARPSPLINGDLNVLGHYSFILAQQVTKDQLF